MSKNTSKLLIFGNVSSNFSTTYGLVNFSYFILPLYRKKSYIIPDNPSLPKFSKLHFCGFLWLYWRISPYFAGIICSLMECSFSGSIKMQLFLIWSNRGWILNNLLLIFSGFCYSKLSLKCKNSLKFWYLFCDMMSAIIGYLVSLAQYIRKLGKSIIDMYICITISCSVSSDLVFSELPVF